MTRLIAFFMMVWEWFRSMYLTVADFVGKMMRFKFMWMFFIFGFFITMIFGILKMLKEIQEMFANVTSGSIQSGGSLTWFDYLDSVVPMTQFCVAFAIWGAVACAVSLYTFLKSWIPSILGCSVGTSK